MGTREVRTLGVFKTSSQHPLLQYILHVPPAIENAVNIDIISDDLIDDPVWFVKYFPEFEDTYAF